MCEPGCFPPDDDDGSGTTTKNSLRSSFEADPLTASNCLPPAAREKLMTSTPVWINKSQRYGPRVAPVSGRDGCFHPGAGWLVRNGMSPLKCGGVEWYVSEHCLEDCNLW